MQQKNKKYANIYIDDVFVCSLQAITVLKHNLQVGQVLQKDQLESLQLDSEKNAAFDRSIKFLNIRLRSTQEMKEYLLSKGYMAQTVQYCIEKLGDYKYLDDRSFAKVYIASKGQKNGKNKIAYELRQFGVCSTIIDSELSKLDSFVGLFKLIQKKYKGDKNKIIDYCIGRGYRYEEVKDTLDKYLMELECTAIEHGYKNFK
ncbi:MAG: recombination regulator RecX [Clostridiales bacterium]|jgi:regulatory protein|nr:recombination regulator RecX [Clostridiales bacterium]